jgi:hypothetical protein
VYGLAAASAVSRSRSSSSSTRAAQAASSIPSARGPDLELAAHRPGEQLMLRVLEDGADAGEKLT